MKRALLLIATGIVAGCGSPHPYLPLDDGKGATYNVRTPMVSYVATVTRSNDTDLGFLLTGPMGRAVLDWQDGILVAHELGGNRFRPPLPLLNESEVEWKEGWKGRVQGPLPFTSAEGTVAQEEVELQMPTRKLPTLKSTVRLTIGNHSLELETWFARGEGIVRQEQRIDGAFSLAMEKLKG